ncbi:MAG: hypothetical protein IKQ33_04400 [Clostridia bacterium]|nr:hypothetical protein [Clostridia bacterium]MBR4329504.1 hypothetical protein [Candidatus Riflebacteria bacterium]
MSIGRPRKTIKTKRIQAVIPEEILNKLDKKVSSDKNLDRSKALTEAVNEWLGLTKKKRSFENIYKKFFGYSGLTKEDPLKVLHNSENLEIDEEENKIIEIIEKKLFSSEKLTGREYLQINAFIEKQSFNIDKELNFTCTSSKLLTIIEKLFLNSKYPINDYIGHCKYCGKEFFKKKITQKYDTPICKIQTYEEQKNETNNPAEVVRINKIIKNLKSKSNFDVKPYFDRNDNNGFEKLKKIVEDLCVVSNYKYSIFKKKFKQFQNKNEIEGINELYIAHLVRNLSLKEIQNLTLEGFANYIAGELFPDKNNIRFYAAKNLMEEYQNMFVVSKNMALFLKTEREQSIEINDKSQIYTNILNTMEEELGNIFAKTDSETDIVGNYFKEMFENAFKLSSAVKFTIENEHQKAIELCEEVLKDGDKIDALQILLKIYFSIGNFDKVVEVFDRLQLLSDKLDALDESDMCIEKPENVKMLGCIDIISGESMYKEDLNHELAYTGFFLAKEGRFEESLKILRMTYNDSIMFFMGSFEIPSDYSDQDITYVKLALYMNCLGLNKTKESQGILNVLKQSIDKSDSFESLENIVGMFNFIKEQVVKPVLKLNNIEDKD